MKPMIWLTALRRLTIIRSPSSTTDRAKARSSRDSGSAPAVACSITTIDKATRPRPRSMVKPTPPTASMERPMPSRDTMRWSATGMMMALSTSAIAAVM